MTAVQPEFVEALGHRIRIQVSGSGTPLLLLNGLGRSLQSWRPLVAELAGSDRRCIAIDPPGVGLSPALSLPPSIPDIARIAGAVLDAVGVDRADVLGFSYGGAVAQQLSADAPERVRSLVLVSTACGLGATPAERMPTCFGSEAFGGPRDSDFEFGRVLWSQLPGIATWSGISVLGRITAPTLVVCGIDDRVLPPVNSRILARRIRSASLTALPGGHDQTSAERAPRLAAAVAEFLNQADPADRSATIESFG